MVTNERPGVYSSIEVSSGLNGALRSKTVGIAGVSDIGEKGICKHIASYGEAVSAFGAGCGLTKLIRILLMNGAFSIKAVPAAVGTAAETKDYEAAFSVLMDEECVSVMLCDSADAEVHKAMRQAIAGANENCKYRIGVVQVQGDAAAAAAAAKTINCERIVMVYPKNAGAEAPCAEAAAFAGLISTGGDPALPVNGAELFGLEGAAGAFSDADITLLVQAGVTPVETLGGKACAVRGLTTRTTTAGAEDNTWRELTTVLVVDDVIPSVRNALRARFPRVKNTAQTRGAIRTQVLLELENKLKQEIIDSYGAVSAQALAGDPCTCEVSFEFAVAHGLNRINLSAHISV